MSDWRDDNEVDLPEWVAVLDPKRKPIDTKGLNREELVAEFEKRFVALLQKSDAINSLEGWRDVAVDLAFEFHPAFKLKDVKPLPVSGRPITAFPWMLKNAFLSRKRKLERDAEREASGTRQEGKPIQKAAQAAREIAKEWGAAERAARFATRHMSADKSDGINKIRLQNGSKIWRQKQFRFQRNGKPTTICMKSNRLLALRLDGSAKPERIPNIRSDCI